MKVVSVILARGGSKELPEKNIKDLCGRPLIYYSIKASVESESSETWVSTDCAIIKSTAEALGARVLDRPANISKDTSQSEEALIHFVQNVSCDILVFMQPTSPFVNKNYINKGISMMRSYDSVFSVYKKHWIPEWREANSVLSTLNWDIEHRPMRQSAPHKYIENGAFYITTCYSLIKSGLRYSGAIGCVEMLEEDSLQIDSQEDFDFAEKLMIIKNKSQTTMEEL